MREGTKQAAEWIYRGVWGVLSDQFRVPELPPDLRTAEGGFRRSFHPSRRYLTYLKLYFWIGLIVIDLLILFLWIAIFLADQQLGLVLAIPALLVSVVPDIIAYVVIHIRYDTMWYVMTDRSLVCRRGVWVILEHTITFENVQNVSVRRGPVQRLFGIATIVIETAGAAEGEGQNKFAVGNKAIMEGIDNPEEIRDLILERVRRSTSAGLGDESRSGLALTSPWRGEHLRALEEVLEGVRGLG